MQMMMVKVFWTVWLLGLCSADYCEYDDVASVANTMTCGNLTSETDFDEALKASKRFQINKLVITNSSFRFMTQGGFQDTHFKHITIDNCSIMGLSDGDVAFEGLEDILEILQVQHTSLTTHWNWLQLKNLKKLKALKIWDSEVDYISQAMGNLSTDTLIQMEVMASGVSTIHPKAFTHLTKVKQFFLDDNQIEIIQRGVFPNPGDVITVISLRGSCDVTFYITTQVTLAMPMYSTVQFSTNYNKLQNLPADMFENMPNLRTINLHGNLLRTIDEKIFGKVWSNLTIFYMNDSPLQCDCRLTWITKQPSHPNILDATCNSPERLKGLSIKALKIQDLWC